MFLGQFFVKNTKMTLEYFLNYPNRTNFNNRKNAKMAGNSVKKWPFSRFKTRKLGHFSGYMLEILYTYTPDRDILHIFRFF